MAIRPLPDAIRNDENMQCACIGGAVTEEDLQRMLREAGFEAIKIELVGASRDLIKTWAPGRNAEDHVISAFIQGIKPSTV